MTEDELRALVRDAIARHRHAGPAARTAPASAVSCSGHASHATFVLPSGADAGGPCIIEPGVPCNHCGYCKSYGH